MDYVFALDYLKSECSNCELDRECFDECVIFPLRKAVEKQIPHKPKQVNKCTYWVCDNCGDDVGDSKTHSNYCGRCGQLQDWTQIKYWREEK